MAKNRLIALRLTPETHARWEEAARARGTTVSVLVRTIVENELVGDTSPQSHVITPPPPPSKPARPTRHASGTGPDPGVFKGPDFKGGE